MDKAMVLAGTLKPEARLGIALSEFAGALDEKHRTKFMGMRAKSSSPPSAQDIIRITEELNRDGARLHRTWRPYSTRVAAFLTRLQSLAGIGDVAIGGSQNLMISGVWCAVRMCLEATIGFVTYFDKVTSMFMKLGTSWSLHRDFAKLFPRSQELQIFLTEYLIIIVTLCRKAVEFNNRSGLSQFAASLVSSFKSTFDPLLVELQQWSKLLEQKSKLLAAEFSLNAETGAIERSLNLARRLSSSGKQQRNFDMKQRLLLLLCPNQAEYELQWRRQRRKGTCSWIFESPDYQSWRQGQDQESSYLWVSGSLGSGKTVVLANIVADIHLRQQALFFFCNWKLPGTLKAGNIVGSLAHQVLNNIPTERTFWNSLNLDDVSTKAASLDGIVELLLAAVPKGTRLFVVLDGLEECSGDDISDVLSFLQPLTDARCVHLCISSRPGTPLYSRSKFTMESSQRHNVSMKSQARYDEVEKFITMEIERRTAGRPLDADLEALMKAQLVVGAQGMYLWVVLQLESMLPDYSGSVVSPADIRAILENLPEDLPQAFDQTLHRIRQTSYGNRLFKLVAVADRPLGLDETRVAMTVVQGETTWQPEKLPPDGAALIRHCGGNLVEVDEEDGNIYFIHHSALLHLLSQPTHPDTERYHFTLTEAEIEMGEICVTYLNYGIFQLNLTLQRNIEATGIRDTVVRSATASSPIFGLIARHVVSRQKGKSPSFNIARVAQEYQLSCLTQHDPEVARSLLGYATTFWLEHTRQFEMCTESRVWECWKTIIEGGLHHVKVPWKPAVNSNNILVWAIQHSHASLLEYFIRHHRDRVPPEDVDTIVQHTNGDSTRLAICGYRLGDILAQYLDHARWEPHCVAFLLEAGASPTRLHRLTGLSPLEIFMQKDWLENQIRKEILQRFVAHADVERWAKESDIRAILLAAILQGFPDEALALLQMKPAFGTVESSGQNSLLGAAVSVCHLGLITELILRGCRLTETYVGEKGRLSEAKDVIEWAWESTKANILLRTIMAGAEPGIADTRMKDGTTILHHAVATNRPDLVSILLQSGANPILTSPALLPVRYRSSDVSVRVVSPLQLAIELKSQECYRLLIAQGESTIWNPKSPGHETCTLQTAFRVCLENASEIDVWLTDFIYPLLRRLGPLSSEGVLEMSDRFGNTVLHHAAAFGWTNIQPLLSAGAGVEVTNYSGETPLHVSCSRFSTLCVAPERTDLSENTLSGVVKNVIRPLLGASALIHTGVYSPLQRASPAQMVMSRGTFSPFLEALVRYGHDAKLPNHLNGETLLHLAVKSGYVPIIRTVLDYGVDVDVAAVDDSGSTAVDVAIRRGRITVVATLAEKLGDDGRTLSDYSREPFTRALEGIKAGTAKSSMVTFLLGTIAVSTHEKNFALETFLAAMESYHYYYYSKDKVSSLYRPLNQVVNKVLLIRPQTCHASSELMGSVLALVHAGANPNAVVFGVPVLKYAMNNRYLDLEYWLIVKGATVMETTEL